MDQLEQPGAHDAYVLKPESDEEERRAGILNALASTLVRKRRDAVSGRAATCIEIEWLADEEFYQGYDDANRNEFVNTANKPMSGGGATEDEKRLPVRGSTVFPNITQPYVDSAAARVGDMLLPTDDRNFAIDPTPVPEMFDELERMLDKAGLMTSAQPAQPAAAPMPQPGAMPQAAGMGVPGMPGAPMPVAAQGQMPAPPGMPPGQPTAPGQPPQAPSQPEPQVMVEGQAMPLSQAKAKLDAMKQEAARKAEKAQTQIDDWLTECQYHGEMRKVIDDCAKIGSGVIKGPFPVKRVSQQWRRNEMGIYELIRIEEIKPASRRVDPWDLFPDPACGESIHNGAYIWERDRLTSKQLEDLVGVPGYSELAILQCLKEGPMRQQEADMRNLLSTAYAGRDQYEVWYFHGTVKVEELEAAGCDCEGMEPERSMPALMTMVNDHVIKASLNPLDDGQFPYDVVPWKRRPGIPWGMGIARQMRTPQRIVVAATRNLMDNAGLASGPQLVFRYGMEPEDGVWEIVPLKIWTEDSAAAGTNAGPPVTPVVIPMLQAELLSIVQFGMKLAEDVTGLPMLLQGQPGAAPDTVGGMVMLDNNATAVLRRFARLFDSQITEPHIRRYYTWLMEYGQDDDAKGDFQINARGSSALVERDIQSQEMIQIVQLVLNPAYGKSPEKAMDEFLKSRRFNPANFDYTEEEKKQKAAQSQQPPPEDPRIVAAKLKVASDEKIAGMRQQGDQSKLSATQQFDAQEADKDRQLELTLAGMDQQIAQFEQANDREMTTQELKAMLFKTTASLRTQKELSAMSLAANTPKSPHAMTPPTEPAGRAQAGAAFQQ